MDAEAEKLIDTIRLINSKFSDAEWVKAQPVGVLSYTALRLAAMKSFLLDVRVDAQITMLENEVELDKAKAEAYARAKKEYGTTAAGDLKHKDEEYIAAKQKYNDSKVIYDRMRAVISDTHDLIEALRGRIIDMNAERRDQGVAQ